MEIEYVVACEAAKEAIWLKKFLTDLGIMRMEQDIVLGRVDRSAITITWVMTELVRNPRVMKKVQAEIRSYIGTKPYVDESELENLQYLKMVLKETFGLHPPLALLIPLEAISHFRIGGYDINLKKRIMINAWAIGRNPNTWKNPDKFYPERFEDNAIDFRSQNFELLSFGSGRRMCPGITMGSIEVMVTLANLLYRFYWNLPNEMKREDVSVEEGIGLTIYRKLPLYLVPIIYDCEKTLEQ
ncbi:cytochrome P450 71B26-like [Castanea sativa]|uniref:cytochrome P450 71B26-like n=1 Tax=Castanea sativa TaxID=21020 RepID=UPI003F65117B